MLPSDSTFSFEYADSTVHFGRNSVANLEECLAEHGAQSALIVCGSNVGANADLMGPLREGLGSRLGGVFDGTTPDKSIEDVFAGIEAIRESDPDVLVGVGGGSSLDIARQMSVLEADGRSLEEIKRAAREGGLTPPEPERPPKPVIVIPTTFAGAADSSGGSIIVLSADESPTAQPVRIGGSLRPIAMFYDPALFETTPTSVLAGSAMNGFNKGLETIYSSASNPITDATAVHGLRLLQDGFTRLSSDRPDGMDESVVGTILVQFERNTNVIHAFGHGFSRRYPVQQGKIHAIVAPHVLEYLFDEADARRNVLAEGLNVDTARASDPAIGEAIVTEVRKVRNGFELPTRLRDLEPVREEDIPKIAEFIVSDTAMARAPESVPMGEGEVEEIIRSAW
ncbi:Alcohol dehydrogenase, class IV [Natronorubrum sediminis]|uniref:Alcohol dehydrogenase, class IV n=1 Tax=Natronorubrum sediminis TaxID=640943 RepID=A0A1H6FRP8_9EURY|nr:iron-containing alcohol dehydrogenase family protein [Natronorubrum sediminis]SEH13569.1 Alcohol dehydrogenase, class IV [Natronorubrum sediminis]